MSFAKLSMLDTNKPDRKLIC